MQRNQIASIHSMISSKVTHLEPRQQFSSFPLHTGRLYAKDKDNLQQDEVILFKSAALQACIYTGSYSTNASFKFQ